MTIEIMIEEHTNDILDDAALAAVKGGSIGDVVMEAGRSIPKLHVLGGVFNGAFDYIPGGAGTGVGPWR